MTDPPIVNLNENKPLGDILVEFIGLNRISQSNFRRHVELIKSSTNVIELLQNINHTNQVLSQLGIFQPFERNGHEAYAFADIKRGANPGDVKVEISVKEQRPNCSFGANVDSRSNAGFEAKATIPGFMGYINNLELNANISGTSSNQLDCILNIPQPFGFNIYGSLQLFKTMQDNSYQSSFFADIKGLNLSLRDSKSRHCFSWGTSIRDLVPLYNDKRRASESILSSCGRSIKNSVKYKFHRDEIETDQVPISGNATSCSLEFGIAGGDSRFAKFEAEALYAKKLNDFMVFNLMASVGYLNHLPVYHKKSHLLDRFYFSGTSGSSRLFRGFSKLIGPFDTGFRNDDGQWKPCYDYLGGDYYSNVQITMYFLNKKVPFFQPMLCTNLGTLSSLKGSDLSNIYSQAANDLRASVGAGVSMNVGTGVWLECCISYPLLSQQNDVPSNVHIGLRFKPS
ncbi:Sorting and assembly machinery component 50 homolog A [Babesia microti strain RI]|uniref:Sorting and assembly machinery component 50 homolog A n=1 Tax=Babesia microti (strain RI) TaxID=1133968 RepID=A0A1N6LYE1_BABMR|nr:Sorting and assembly machinery component 50 homolog A [Babesia microti strain RI]SIO73906.1 Sorting and assembly machinery component 50 homolog A [Babesia microti strain RI]|eukprot:XP_021337956.1 Sorting and assembly machinery component 50 homolog A [Babesia microti strain RI]